MVKRSSRIHYCLDGKWMDVSKLYGIVSKSSRRNGKVLGSIAVEIRESKTNPDLLPVRLVFVEDRQAKGYLVVLSTDTSLADEEILRIYGKRWDIEVFFKMCKSYLSLSKEFQGRSYDMMTAHTTIVFMRYIMLALEARNATDYRTVGGFFYDICDEMQDIRFTEALMLLLSLLKQALVVHTVISEEMANRIVNSVFQGLPVFWKQKLQLSA